MFGLGITELLLILVVILLLFGAKKLPEIGKALGQGMRLFKKEADEMKKAVSDEEKEQPSPKKKK